MGLYLPQYSKQLPPPTTQPSSGKFIASINHSCVLELGLYYASSMSSFWTSCMRIWTARAPILTKSGTLSIFPAFPDCSYLAYIPTFQPQNLRGPKVVHNMGISNSELNLNPNFKEWIFLKGMYVKTKEFVESIKVWTNLIYEQHWTM